MLFLIPLMLITFFYECFFSGKSLFLGDNLLIIAPHKIFIWESLKKGVLPLWNPHMWAGFPEVGDITLGLFNPFNIIHFIFSDMYGTNVVALVAYFIAFVGTYFFLRNERLQKSASLLGAVIFTFSGSMINISLDIIRIESICFLPWTLFAIRKNKFYLTVVFLTLNFLVGQTQYYYMSLVFIFGFLLFFSQKEKLFSIIIEFLLSVILSLGLSAFTLLPQIELLKFSSRANADISYNTIWSLHPASLVRFLFADFWGRRNEGSFWGPDVTYSFGYVGFFVLIFIISFFRKVNNRHLVFFALSAILSLLIAFGKFNPFHQLFLLIPGFSFFRNPSSWLIIYSFSLACLAAYIFSEVDFQSPVRFRKLIRLTGYFLSFLGFMLLAIQQFFPSLPHEILALFAGILHKNLSLFHSLEVDRGIAFLVGRNLLFLGLLSLLLSVKFNKKFFVMIVFLDLFIFSKGDLFLAPGKTLVIHGAAETAPIQFLKKNIGGYRFISTAEFSPVRGLTIYMGDYFRRPPFLQPQFWSLNEKEFVDYTQYTHLVGLLSPNIFTALGLPSINGYSSFSLKNYNSYFAAPSAELSSSAKRIAEVKTENKGTVDPTRVNFDYISLTDERLSRLAVKYILADEKLKLPGYRQYSFSDGFFIYENPKASPRVNIYSSTGELKVNPEVHDLNANEVVIDIPRYQFQKGDYLILRDAYYPGWRAFDQNNHELKIVPQEIFRRIALPKNIRQIFFRYQPESFYNGIKISVVTFISLVFFQCGRILLAQKRSKNMEN